MRKILIAFTAFLFAYGANAQLADTKWKGSLNVQGGMDVVFNFGADTVDVTIAESGESLEVSKYIIQDSVITFEKIFGQSQCDSTAGKYAYNISDKELSFKLVSDGCPDRSDAIDQMKLEKED